MGTGPLAEKRKNGKGMIQITAEEALDITSEALPKARSKVPPGGFRVDLDT